MNNYFLSIFSKGLFLNSFEKMRKTKSFFITITFMGWTENSWTTLIATQLPEVEEFFWSYSVFCFFFFFLVLRKIFFILFPELTFREKIVTFILRKLRWNIMNEVILFFSENLKRSACTRIFLTNLISIFSILWNKWIFKLKLNQLL